MSSTPDQQNGEPAAPAPVKALLSMTKPDVAANVVKRAPSLSELVQSMRAQNPEKFDKLEKGSSVAGPAPLVAVEESLNDGRRHSLSAGSDKASDALGTSPGGDGPRLRLPARLAAQAPMLSRSHSSNAMLQTVPATEASTSSLPVKLPSLGTSPARGGLPSLEAIGERFAAKKQEPGTTSSAKSSSSSLDVASSNMGRSKSESTAQAGSSTQVPPIQSLKAPLPNDDAVFKRPRAPTPSPKDPAASMAALQAQAKNAEFPLEHNWTLYYDSRATARAAQMAAKAATTSASHPAGTSSNDVYEAGLSTIGTFATVQSFCRLYNWTKRPSKMGLNENLHLFKDGIMPMWEDPKNHNGGKWVLQVDVGKREEIDRFWTWLCLALVGEDFADLNDEICGAVVSTRPRFYRIQLWLRNKENVAAINIIGKRVLQLLELEDSPAATSSPAVTPTSGSFPASLSPKAPITGVLLEFSYHSKGAPPKGQFLTFGTMAPAPQVAGGPGSAFANFGSQQLGNSKILTPARPPGLGLGGNQYGMTRAASMNAIAEVGKSSFGAAPPPRPTNWRERLGTAASPRKPQHV